MATTDDNSLTPTPEQPRAADEISSRERRRRAHELLSTNLSQLARLETELDQRMQQVADEVTQELAHSQQSDKSPQVAAHSEELEALRRQLAAHSEEFEALRRQLAVQSEELGQSRRDFEQARIASAKLEQELRIRDALSADNLSQREKTRIEMAALGEQLADAQAQLGYARNRQEALRGELERQREQSAAAAEKDRALRTRVARRLKKLRAARQVPVEIVVASDAQADELRELRDKLATFEQQWERLAVESDRAAVEANEAKRRAEQLAGERDRLTEELAAAEALLGESSKAVDSRKREELQRRFEMAVEDLRELKKVNAELEARLAKVRTGPAPAGSPGGLDWESQKQRLLASLEADDDQDEEAVEERHTIEGTIRITDQIVAQKDEEITELKRLLEERANSPAAQAGGAAAVAEILDRDELVRQEREKLQQAEADWRQKIGKAEIDISVERAKIARDRAELEEKMRLYQRDQTDRAEHPSQPSQPGKPTRGRWLARLGLKDLDEQGQ